MRRTSFVKSAAWRVILAAVLGFAVFGFLAYGLPYLIHRFHHCVPFAGLACEGDI